MKLTEQHVDKAYNGITFGKFADHDEIKFLKDCLKRIKNSNINNELKYWIFNRLEDVNTSTDLYKYAIDFLEDELEYGIVCEVDSWTEVCGEIAGKNYNKNNVTDEILTSIVVNEFKKLGNDFPYDIISGDFTILYEAKK